MTKKELKILEGAVSKVEQAVDLLESAQETLVAADPKFEFPVGIIFSAQTSLRVVVELVRDVSVEQKRGAASRGGKKRAKAGKAR